MSVPKLRQITAIGRPSEVAPASTRALVQVAFARARRALIRFQAARTTRGMVDELEFHLEPAPGRQPLFVDLEALRARYEALGGDPLDLER